MGTALHIPIFEFVRYNNWANQQVLQACEGLTEAQLAATTLGTYGSIRDTLEHIVRAEELYLGLLTGTAPQPPFRWEDRPALAEIKGHAAIVGNALLNAANRFHPSDQVSEEGEGWQLSYRALAIFIQIVNHGVEHRTNITTTLSQGPHAPPEVDGWAYLWAHEDRFDVKRVGGEPAASNGG